MIVHDGNEGDVQVERWYDNDNDDDILIKAEKMYDNDKNVSTNALHPGKPRKPLKVKILKKVKKMRCSI